MSNSREQIKELRLQHPNWSKSDIARALVPPVSPQRVGQIENNTNPYATEEYKERIRHKYHRRAEQKYKRKDCRYCAEE